MSTRRPRDGGGDDNPVKALLRSGVNGILAVTLAVLVLAAGAAVIALVVAMTY
jgi:hypothetical protein